MDELIEVPEHFVGVLDDFLDELSQRREAFRPGPALGVRGEQTCEVLHESQQVPRLLDALGEPFGGALSDALLVLALDQPAKARAPLVEALDDTGAAGRRFPLSDRGVAVSLARFLREPAVGEKGQHVTAAKRRIDQVEEREHPATERSFRDRRASSR